jgi:phenylacetate-CoA ligase
MSDEDANFDRIVKYARETNPFYAEWLKDKDSVPILTRQIVLENNDRILNGHPVTGKTSGSVGIPVRISMSRRRRALIRELSARYTEWLGGPLVTSKILCAPGPYPPSSFDIHSPIEDQIDWLIKRYEKAGAVALLTHPTNAFMLAQTVLEQGRDMSFLQRLSLMGETVDRHQRRYFQRAFPNALIASTYSSVEFGLIAGLCPFEPDFHHIMSDCLRVEVLDDEGRPCAEGQTGRVVITDYFNDWSPLIRYEIGDLAALGACPCGRIPLPAFSAVLGKVRGALKHRSGERLIFYQLSIDLRDVPGMKQHQVVQEELQHFTVRLVIDEPREDEIYAAFENYFGYRPHLTFEYHDFIPRDPSGKFHYSICRV